VGSSTSRLALPYPVGSDPTNVPADIQRLANALDGIAMTYSEGTAGARPAAGQHGRIYYSTDSGAVYYDYGSGWIQLNVTPASIAQAKGDLLIGSGAGQLARLPVGSDGQVLQALSGTPNGVQWANVAGTPAALPGATAGARFVGGTVAGSPASGTFQAGDFVIDQTGEIWVCFQSGSPGYWRSAHAPAIGQPMLLIGASAPSRFVGGTTSGPPTQGTYYVGDFVIDQTGGIWVCVQGGTPGTWSGLIKLSQFTAFQSVTQIIVRGTWVTLTFDTVSIDTDSGRDRFDRSIFRCRRTGNYRITGGLALPGLSGCVQGVGVRLLLNGSPIVGSVCYQGAIVGGWNCVSSIPVTVQLQAGDVIQVQGYHDADSDHSTPVDQDDVRCRFNVEQCR
jgi:hypothetical protein